MRVGIDFRAMQIGHQFRGIGEVVRQACRQLDGRLPVSDVVVAIRDRPGPSIEPLLDDLFTSGRPVTVLDMPSAATGFARVLDNLSADQHRVMNDGADVLVQFDFQLGVPTMVPTVLVVHDQIPILLGDRYPHIYWPHYRVARRSGLGRRTSAERAARRWRYQRNLETSLRRARRVLVDSNHTGATTLGFAAEHRIDDLDARLSVARLGTAAPIAERTALNAMELARFEALGLDDVPFVFYMGGIDDRRRIDLLVAAYNDLRAGGVSLKLVLAGESFQSPETVSVQSARQALMASSYRRDIHLLGYVSEPERVWLYGNAQVFVFPSEHEGFGLPVLESLAAGCSVVAFDNTSMPEVCGPGCTLVAPRWPELAAAVRRVLERSDDERSTMIEAGRTWAEGFTWDVLGGELSAAVEELRSERASGSAPGDQGDVTTAEKTFREVVDELG